MAPTNSALSPSPSRGWLIAAIIGVVLAGGVWLYSILAVALSCSEETSVCAETTEPTAVYNGRLFDYQGQPVSNQTLLFQSEIYGPNFEARVVTDEQGRFCIRAVESLAYIGVSGQQDAYQLVVDSTAPVDPRFADPALADTIRRKRSVYSGRDRYPFLAMEPAASGTPAIPLGAHKAVALWNPTTDLTSDCQTIDAKVPWVQQVDAKSTWQFGVLLTLPVAAAVLLSAGLQQRRGWRSQQSGERVANADRLVRASCAAAAASILFVILLLAGVAN